jgi:glucokinase
MRVLGLDLGGTNIKRVLLEDDRVVARDSEPTRSEEGVDAVLDRLTALAREAGTVGSVGVAVPGLVDSKGRGVLLPNLHGDWVGRPIAEPLRQALGRSVRLLNDGHAFALAEARIGAARGVEDVLCIVCGTGIGGGLVIGGLLHLGVEDRAGEVGHHTVVEDGPLCACGNRGCLETLAGARAIAGAAGQSSFDDVVVAARRGDERAREALHRAAAYIGIAIANLTIFLAPQRIVVGGGVAEAGELLLNPLHAEVKRRAGRVAPLHAIEIVRATLGADAGAIGAALAGADGDAR